MSERQILLHQQQLKEVLYEIGMGLGYKSIKEFGIGKSRIDVVWELSKNKFITFDLESNPARILGNKEVCLRLLPIKHFSIALSSGAYKRLKEGKGFFVNRVIPISFVRNFNGVMRNMLETIQLKQPTSSPLSPLSSKRLVEELKGKMPQASVYRWIKKLEKEGFIEIKGERYRSILITKRGRDILKDRG